MIRDAIPLTIEGAHVWTADPEELRSMGLLGGFSDILSSKEHARLRRFRFERDRLSYVAAHGLARLVLSACVPSVRPEEWEFRSTHCGRPEVVAPHVGPAPRFNISHTGRLVACLVVAGIDCGVDVETLDRVIEIDRLVPSTLSAAERGRLSAVSGLARPELFFRYWTLKEAYVKARGCGIAMPLDSCTFAFRADDGQPELVCAPDIDAAEWQFAQWPPTASHMLAVALRRGRGADYRIVRHEGVPTLWRSI